MNKSIAIILLSAAAFVAAPIQSSAFNAPDKKKVEKKAKKANETVTFNTNMHCHNCQKKLLDNLAFEKGVKDLDVNLDKQTITFTYDPAKTNPEKLAEAVRKLGYKAEK